MIKGFDSLMSKMYYLGTIADPDELNEVAESMERDAKLNCPVKTGNLQSSIDSEVSTVGKRTTIKLYAKANYAAHVEYGTSKMAARPFLTPAFNKNKDNVTRKIRNNIKKVVK